MFKFGLALLFSAVAVSSLTVQDFINDPVKSYSIAVDGCAGKLKIAPALLAKYKSFDFPDTDDCRAYLRCKCTDLGLWTDEKGLDLVSLNLAYEKQGKTDVVLPALTKCNENLNNDTSDRWLRKSIICVLATPAGVVFKTLVKAAELVGSIGIPLL